VRIKKFNESTEYNEVQDILNIARDEDYYVIFSKTNDVYAARTGHTHAISIQVDTGDDYTRTPISKEDQMSFLLMCKNIEDRLKHSFNANLSISCNDNFFEKGKQSIPVSRLIDNLEKWHNIDIDFAFCTIRIK